MPDYEKPDPYKKLAVGSAILAGCVLTLYILQRMGIVPLNPF
jgi:hypothetical protein